MPACQLNSIELLTPVFPPQLLPGHLCDSLLWQTAGSIGGAGGGDGGSGGPACSGGRDGGRASGAGGDGSKRCLW